MATQMLSHKWKTKINNICSLSYLDFLTMVFIKRQRSLARGIQYINENYKPTKQSREVLKGLFEAFEISVKLKLTTNREKES